MPELVPRESERSVPPLESLDGPSRAGGSRARGYLEACEDFAVRGWAHDEARPGERLEIDVVDEHGSVVAHGKADIFRADVREAGVADGRCAFLIPLSPSVADGKPHRLRAMVADTGDLISGELDIVLVTTATGEIHGIDGRFVTGWASDHTRATAPVTVQLVEGGRTISTAVADRFDRGRANGFRLPVPDELLDGRPHAFSVRVEGAGPPVASAAIVTPTATPRTDSLRPSIAAAGRAWMDARAPHRYASMTRQLSALLDGPNSNDWTSRLAVLDAAHQTVERRWDRRLSVEELHALAFPVVTSPKVTVIVPVKDQLVVTLHCLASLILAPNQASFEVIVSDDGSTDDTPALARAIDGVGYARSDETRGFVQACNLGATSARGEYVVLLNNDCEVTAGWLDALLDVFERFDRVGLAGAKLLYPDGRQQEAGAIIWGGGEAYNYGRDGNAADPKYNYVRQIDYASGACVMIPRGIWEAVGGFDERYSPAYYEDVDLAFRIRQKGYKTVYTPFSEVFHFEGKSNGTSVESGIKRFQSVNAPKFKARWIDMYRGSARFGHASPDVVKDRNVAHRALVVDVETPQLDHDAGSHAIVQEMRLLQSLGFKVTFVAQNPVHLGAYTETLQRMGIECLFAPFVDSPSDALQKRGGEFDLVYCARYYVAARAIDAARKYAPQARVVLNNIDLHFLRELRAALVAGDRDSLPRVVQTRDDELATMRQVDLVLSYNDTERDVILSHCLDSVRVLKCPWVVALPKQVVGWSARADIAFLGQFGHPPNVDAVQYFVRSVMPILRSTLPGVRFRIYGNEMRPEVAALAAHDVLVDGYVPHVSEVYDTCRVFVAPLRSGAGLKGKVVDALAYGVPSVISRVAAEGMSLRDGEEAVVVDTPEATARAIVELYQDEKRWTAMSSAARAHAANAFSFERGQELMAAALQAVGLFVAPDASALRAS